MENEDLVSVIIPIYNVEKYLEKSIDSVINQTYKNIEIILVDDGSKDNSGKICDKYINIDNRIKVIHKENGGLSDARNKGIEIATGKYISFIDSDDFVKEDYIKYLYNLIKKYNTQISICAYSILMENGKKIDCGEKYEEKLLTTEECFERMLCEDGFTVSANAKMYDIELFKDVRYPKGRLCEDNGTTYKLIDKVDKIAYGNISNYYYLKRNGSIMLSKFNIRKMDMIELTDEMCDYLEEKYPSIIDAINRRRIYSRFNILRQVIQEEEYKNIEDNVIEYILDNKNNIIKNPKSPKRDKIALICLMIGKRFFRFVWNVYNKIKY